MNVHWVTSTSSITIYIRITLKVILNVTDLWYSKFLSIAFWHTSVSHHPQSTKYSARQDRDTFFWFGSIASNLKERHLSSWIIQTTSIYISLGMHTYMYIHVCMCICICIHISLVPFSLVKRYVCLYNHTADLLKEMLPLFSNKIFTSLCLLMRCQSHFELL